MQLAPVLGSRIELTPIRQQIVQTGFVKRFNRFTDQIRLKKMIRLQIGPVHEWTCCISIVSVSINIQQSKKQQTKTKETTTMMIF